MTSTMNAAAGASVFELRDCALITRMGGVDSALNLRELRERVHSCPIESIFHHFCETPIRATFDDPEFRNDLAVWAARHLRDRTLAERLGIINPYAFDSLEALRLHILDVLDERLSEVETIPWVPREAAFRFMRAVTIVFATGTTLSTPDDLAAALPGMSGSSIYYHFIEARRRTGTHADDFSRWLAALPSPPHGMIEALTNIDFYFLGLDELRSALVRAVTGGDA